MSESAAGVLPNTPSQATPSGYLTFTLHAHLPYVINHGTWPHGIEWLHEAAAETYLPLLRVLKRLERDGIALNCNLVLSPVLMEQLAHPVFHEEFPRYIERKVLAAREDEAYFNSTGEGHYAEIARFWQRFFSEALHDFEALGRNIVRGFQYFHEKGLIEIVTGGASHGYLPLLGTDESVRAQIRAAVDIHQRHLGVRPKGIWIPECGYRPAGFWDYPTPNPDGSTVAPGFQRIGTEQAIGESGLEFFFVDTHLIEDASVLPRTGFSPYLALSSESGSLASEGMDPSARPEQQDDHRRLFQPYFVGAPGRAGDLPSPPTVFPRDPRSGAQVWSGDSGYPSDPEYLDFHKKRWPGGHRYWRVTGDGVNWDEKQPYYPNQAAQRVQAHASHFVDLVWQSLKPSFEDSVPAVFSSPFDAELFGHWWFEGAMWLEAVARILHDHPCGLELITGSKYLEAWPRAGSIRMKEGSWGAEGNNFVWLNRDTEWTYPHIYAAELFTREVCTADKWREGPLARRIVQQLCRELLLVESSDWQFLITTGAARDYAEQRFNTHNDQFNEIKMIWKIFEATGAISSDQEARLAAIEQRDSIFLDIDPGLWASGAKATPRTQPDSADAPSSSAMEENVLA